MTMKSRNSWTWFLAGAVSVCLFVSVGCGKKSETEKALSLAKSLKETVAPSSEMNDYTKPYLTEEKIVKFIDSLKEEINPFGVLFNKSGQVQTLSDLQEKIEQYNGFAKKYGFGGYADYMAVWGRIMVGEMVIAGEAMLKGTEEMYENMLKSAEENLKKPDLDPEMRKMYEDQVESSKKGLEDLRKPETDKSLNDADLSLVRKYKPQIDEATKKYEKNRSPNTE